MTNSEKIKAMSSEELFDFLYEVGSCEICIYRNDEFNRCVEGGDRCKNGIKAWLESECAEMTEDGEYDYNWCVHTLEDIFLTKEEAEKALKDGEPK